VPTDLHILHDKALLQENRRTKQENEKFQFVRTLADTPNRKRHFRARRRPPGKSIKSAQGYFYAKSCYHGLKGHAWGNRTEKFLPKMSYAQTVTLWTFGVFGVTV
jgi:hypothetical protein